MTTLEQHLATHAWVDVHCECACEKFSGGNFTPHRGDVRGVVLYGHRCDRDVAWLSRDDEIQVDYLGMVQCVKLPDDRRIHRNQPLRIEHGEVVLYTACGIRVVHADRHLPSQLPSCKACKENQR